MANKEKTPLIRTKAYAHGVANVFDKEDRLEPIMILSIIIMIGWQKYQA